MSRQRREVHEANMGRCTDLEQAWQNSHDLQISQFSIYLDFQSTDYTDLVANQFVFVYLGKLKLTIFDYQ